MQSTPMKDTDPHDVFAIESLLAAHAERAPTLVHDPAAPGVPPVHVAPPISVDPERYWRDPKQSFEELWREFNSFFQELCAI